MPEIPDEAELAIKHMVNYLRGVKKDKDTYIITDVIFGRKIRGLRPHCGIYLEPHELKRYRRQLRMVLNYWEPKETGWTVEELPDNVKLILRFRRIDNGE